MKIHPYVMYDGCCEEAFLFYEKHLGAQIVALTRYENSPMAERVEADWRGKILHGRIKIADGVVMASDAPPGRYEKPRGMSLSLNTTASEEAERIFSVLAERGLVSMPLQQTFWAVRFGMLVDSFGIPWMIDCEQPA